MARSSRARSPVRQSAYASIADELDLRAALSAGLERNDLLPPRPDDRAGGEVAERFIAALEALVVRGRYEADRSLLVPVAKANYSTRPAALLTAADRVVYHALIEPLRGRLEKGLVSPTALLWPRAEPVDKQWVRFETAPTTASGDYIVRADVAGFYESVDHDVLGARLITLTGKTALVDVLIDFLGQVMGAPRGLPQGLVASDVLATAYLSSVDSGMLRYGYAYWRHGDDVRVTVTDHDAGRRAVNRFEGLLRSVRLLMNSDKTRVLKRETYERHSRAVDDERRQVRDELAISKERAVLKGGVDADEVASLVERAGIDEQTQWDIFYHGTLDLEDIVEQLRPHLIPDDIELAFGMYSNAVSRAPDSEATRVLGPEEFHGMLSSSLTTLIAARDVRPLPDIASLVSRFPSETELLATYLRALAESRPTEVSEQVDIALSGGYMTAWQQAWLLGALREVVDQAPGTNVDSGLDRALALARDEEASWLARVEAARLLGAGHRLDQELLSRLWAAAPAAVRADLAAAAAAAAANLSAAEPLAWAEAFLDSLREDPLLVVVLHRSR